MGRESGNFTWKTHPFPNVSEYGAEPTVHTPTARRITETGKTVFENPRGRLPPSNHPPPNSAGKTRRGFAYPDNGRRPAGNPSGNRTCTTRACWRTAAGRCAARPRTRPGPGTCCCPRCPARTRPDIRTRTRRPGSGTTPRTATGSAGTRSRLRDQRVRVKRTLTGRTRSLWSCGPTTGSGHAVRRRAPG